MRDNSRSRASQTTRPRGFRLTSPPVLILLAIFACGGSVGLQLFLKKRAEAQEASADPNTPRTEVVQHPTRRFQSTSEQDERAFYVRGFAESSAGTGLASAQIRLGLLQGEHWTEIQRFEPQVNGNFEVDLEDLAQWSPGSLADMLLEARASAPDHQPLRVRTALPTASREIEMDLVFEAGHSLSGQVIDAEGTPVTGATIDVFLSTPVESPNAERKRRVTTDAEGRFICGWPLGSHLATIDAMHSSFGKRTVFLDHLEPNTDHELESPIQLEPGKTLSGFVSCPNGDSLPDIRIVARKASDQHGTSGRASRRSVVTGENGAFHFTDLEHDSYVLVVEDASHPVGPFQVGRSDIALEIEAPRLVVQVQDSTGRPLPGALLEIVNVSRRGEHGSPLFETTEHCAEGPDATIIFAPSQRYAGQAPESELSLAVILRGGPSNRPPFEQAIEIPADACRIDAVFRYLPEERYGEIRVRLADPRGGWVQNPQVTVTSASTQRSFSSLDDIDPEPEAFAAAIPPGDYTLLAQPSATQDEDGDLLPTLSLKTVHVESGGGADLDLTANLGGRVELELTLREKPATSSAPRVRGVLPSAQVLCILQQPTNGEDPQRELHFIRDGREVAEIPVEGTHRAVEALSPGTYRIEITGENLIPSHTRVKILPGETTKVQVEVPER